MPYPEEKVTFLFTVFILFFALKLFVFVGLGDFFYKDFRICSIYVFTRKDNRINWFIDKVLRLIKYIGLYYIGISIIIVIVGHLNNIYIMSAQYLCKIFVVSVVLNMMSTLLFVLLANILSLYIPAEMSLSLTLLLYTFAHVPAFIKINSQIQNLVIKLDPVLQSVLPWHDDAFLTKYTKLLDMPTIADFSVWWSVLLLGVYLGVVILAGIKAVRTVEITNKI